jgi:hypothetical protein
MDMGFKKELEEIIMILKEKAVIIYIIKGCA